MKNPYFQLVALSWRYAREDRPRMVQFYVRFILSNLALLAYPFLLGQIFNALQAGGMDMIPRLLKWMGIYAVVTIGFWALHGPARLIERNVAFANRRRFGDELYAKINALPMKWHQNHHSGDTIKRIDKAAGALYDFGQTQYRYITFITCFIGVVIALAFVSWQVALVAALSGMTAMLIIHRYDSIMIPLLRQENEMEYHFSSAFFDYVSNIATILSLRISERTREELMRRISAIAPVFGRTAVINEWKWFALTLCTIFIQVAILFFYIWLETRHNTTLMVGNAVMVFQYLRRMTDMTIEFAQSYEQIIRWHTNFESVQSIERDYAARDANKTGKLDDNWQCLGIEIPNFSYEGNDHQRHQLHKITLNIHRGQKIALVGASGAGKSTLLGLLRGMYESEQASVAEDGKHPVALAALSSQATLIPQEPEIFANTIRYNITTGVEHTQDELENAVYTACFDRVVLRLEQGVETDIREKGINLSGGEKQRLALARGIFSAKDSSILLLDEPTSSVDSANERQIYANLFASFSRHAILSSIHRLHLLEMFDWICVMENGQVVEQGILADLLRLNGVFTRMWNAYHKAHI